jgi:hypothetical protein
MNQRERRDSTDSSPREQGLPTIAKFILFWGNGFLTIEAGAYWILPVCCRGVAEIIPLYILSSLTSTD